jgi:predicted thioesterase
LTEPLQKLRVGMTGRHEVIVTRELTVGGHVEGMLDVYGTPFMILAMEIASGEAIRAHLPAGWVTVGTAVNIRHIAPTSLGRKVVATARLTEIGARSLTFAVEAHDGERKIGDGTHRRAAVDLTTFGKMDAGR